jgi:uncharacterized protein (DUF2235 family)
MLAKPAHLVRCILTYKTTSRKISPAFSKSTSECALRAVLCLPSTDISESSVGIKVSKNIVICCDGTANEFAEDRTNVVKLYYTLEQDPAAQVTFYHPGLGTMEPAGALSTPTRKVTRVLSMALGYGLSSDIRDAYTFLMEQYAEGDQGFSVWL